MKAFIYTLLCFAFIAAAAAWTCQCSTPNRRRGVCKNTPTDGRYYLTSFCDAKTACGTSCGNCSWPYATSRARFRCYSNLVCCRNQKCTTLRVIDSGPACWVEDRADMPIIDASWSTCRLFTGSKGCGSSDKIGIVCRQATVHIPDHDLGECTPDAEYSRESGMRMCRHIPDELAADIEQGNHLFWDDLSKK